jgi:hypothetical protein
MGIVKYSLPQVLDDYETRAKNRAKNEEEKCQMDKKKAKKAKKAKHRHEARKAGLPEPESFEASISKGKGGEDSSHWLNELLEEVEELLADGGLEALGGGPQVPGGAEGTPFIIVDEGGDEAPNGGSAASGP